MNERSIKTLARCAALFALLLAAVSICAAQNAPVVLKVEPPNWWVGHSINPVRVLIHGRNLAGARVEATGAGLQTGLTRINAAGGLACRKLVVRTWDSKLDPQEAKNGLIDACKNATSMVGNTDVFM